VFRQPVLQAAKTKVPAAGMVTSAPVIDCFGENSWPDGSIRVRSMG